MFIIDMMDKNRKLALSLLGEIIEQAQIEDSIHKRNYVNTKASQTIGESWMVFHLKALKELIMEETKK